MEKYLVIIILVVLTYYLFNCWVENKVNNILKTKEGFAGTTGSTNDADVASSINTLAQIAKDLQAGGLTVPGALNIKAGINTDGDINAKSAINATGAINAKGGINTDGNINAKGRINTDETINAKKTISVGNTTNQWGGSVVLKGGIEENSYIVFQDNKENNLCRLMGVSDGVSFDKNLRVSGDLIAQGSVIRNNPIYRNHDVAGYLQIRAFGYKIPLYYGFNMLFRNHDIMNSIRIKNNLKDYQCNYNNVDIATNVRADDKNYTLRYLTIFPSYKAKIYYHLWKSGAIVNAGEHAFDDSQTQILHAVWVVLDSEQDPPVTINI